MIRRQTILADLTWTGARFEPDIAVEIDAQGRIIHVGPIAAMGEGLRNAEHVMRLKDHALLPGMIYAHSHAFQRELRNRPERFDTGSGSFWTWRDSMYALVEQLDPDSFYESCTRCFAEMLLAGVTSVGEFHYLRHSRGKSWAFDDAILSSARDAGIRMVLIQSFYLTGGVRRPLAGAQERFSAISMDEFLQQFDRLASRVDGSMQKLALSCHSIRAADIEDIASLYRRAIELDVPFHVHVEEQRQEIDECVATYGANPLRLLLQRLPVDSRFTAIHCTHSSGDDLRELGARGGRICLCPSTEGNLADGVPKLREMRQSGAKICIGSDCNLRISMNEDLRWLELVHRLVNETSGIVVDATGQVAPGLFELATVNGAGALGLEAGSIKAGNWGDLVAIALNHPSLVGSNENSLMHAFIFGCANDAIDYVWVGGQRRV